MNMCKFNYHGKEEFPLLYCSKTDEICMYSKKCLEQRKYIPTELQNKCPLNKEKVKIPNGAFEIVLQKKNSKGVVLYVKEKGQVIKYQTDLNEWSLPYVFIKKLKTKTTFKATK